MTYREEIEIVLNRDDKQYGNYQFLFCESRVIP